MIPIISTFRARSSAAPWSPKSIANLFAWWDASQLTGLNDADPVSTFTDFSGAGHDATAAGGARPLYKVNQINGLPALLFDGTDDVMSFTATSGNAITAFMVVKSTRAANGSVILGATGNAGTYWTLRQTAAALSIASGAESGVNATIQDTWVVAEMYCNGSEYAIAINGTYDASPTADSSSPNFDQCGYPFSSAFHIAGNVAEGIIVSRAMSVGEKSQARSYLGAKYGITVA